MWSFALRPGGAAIACARALDAERAVGALLLLEV
jgi:hypothetical protein